MTEQNWKIGDCQDLMKEMEPDSVDLIVTDPPYGYSFMGKDWDRAVPTVNLWKDALRVLKPGAFAFIMSAPRQDVLAHNLVNLSDAGFNTGFTSIYWTYASGFPKAGNIGKMVDKRLGVEREIICENPYNDIHGKSTNDHTIIAPQKKSYITAPATPQAKELDGSYSGFQPKPAVEIIMVVMKPLAEKTYVEQAMANQKGITWLDDGRIPYQSDDDEKSSTPGGKISYTSESWGQQSGLKKDTQEHRVANTQGRFPANLLVSDDVLNDNSIHKSGNLNGQLRTNGNIYGNYKNDNPQYVNGDSGSFSRYFDIDKWFDLKYLPKEAQKTFPFMIIPKASKGEKNGSLHPTIKPIKLFTYLITIGSREGNLVLDPFLGSGTTLQSGRLTNRNVIGFELDPQWEQHYTKRAMKNTPQLDSFW